MWLLAQPRQVDDDELVRRPARAEGIVKIMAEEDDFEAELRASARRRRGTLVAIGLLAFGMIVAFVGRPLFRRYHPDGAPTVTLTPAQEQELRATIMATTQQLTQLDAPWRPAIAAVDPRALAAGASCTELNWAKNGLAGSPQSSDWGSWSVDRPLDINGSSNASFSHTPFPLRFIAASDDLPQLSPAASGKIARLEELVHGWSTTPLAEREEMASVRELPSTDVLVRITRVVEPKLVPGDRFVPGELEASAWVFDHMANKVVCAGVVTSQSSLVVDPTLSNLNDDLMINLVRALPSSLHAL